MGKKQFGIKINGLVFNKDGSDLTWHDFVDKVERSGISYTGESSPIDEYGNEYQILDVEKWTLGEKVDPNSVVPLEEFQTRSLEKELDRINKLYNATEERRQDIEKENEYLYETNRSLRGNINTLTEEVNETKKLYGIEAERSNNYEETLFSLLAILNQRQDNLVDLVLDSLSGLKPRGYYKAKAQEGKELLRKINRTKS